MSADDPGDPRWWGIRGKVDRFDVRGTPRVGPETIGKPHVPPAIDEAVPHFRARRKATVRQWNVYWESKVPHPDAAWWSVTSGWNPTAQETFDAAWPRELDEDVDRLIDDYGSTWHTAFQVQAPTHYPDFVRQLSDLSGSGRLSLDNMYRGNVDVTVHLALREGPYRTTLQRRRWTFPTIVLCDVCGAEHYADTVRYYLLRRFGLPGVCTVCGHLAAFGDQVVTDSLEVSLAAIKQFVDVVGYIPGVSFRHKFTTVGMTRERRGLMLACAAMIGDPRAITKLHGGTWLKVLQAAGVVGEAWRSSRGTYCIAADGHPCRSLAERSVCDWFERNGVAHEIEPRWPKHPEHNPSGHRRADWKVGDTFIEFAGLMTDDHYASKMLAKQSLADAAGIDLLILTPEDLGTLDRVLSAFSLDSTRS